MAIWAKSLEDIRVILAQLASEAKSDGEGSKMASQCDVITESLNEYDWRHLQVGKDFCLLIYS